MITNTEAILLEEIIVYCALHSPQDILSAESVRMVDRGLDEAWRAMVELRRVGEPVNTYSVARVCTNIDVARLNAIADRQRGKVNPAHLCAHVSQYSELRRRATLSLDAQRASTKRTADEIATDLRAALTNATPTRNTWQSSAELADEYKTNYAAYQADPSLRKRLAIPTGFRDLDSITDGLTRGQMHVLAASTSAGKSSLANAIALHVAESGRVVDIYSREDEPLRVFARIAAARGRHGNRALQKYSLDGSTTEELHGDLDYLATLRLAISDAAYPSVDEMCSAIISRAEKNKTDLIVVDYIQLLHCPAKSRYEELSRISSALFSAARQTNAAMLVLSQLRRGERGARPIKEDIRDCGNVEQDAYSVFLLWPRYLADAMGKTIPATELLVAKQKNGPLGDLLLRFDGFSSTFRDADEELKTTYDAARARAESKQPRGFEARN